MSSVYIFILLIVVYLYEGLGQACTLSNQAQGYYGPPTRFNVVSLWQVPNPVLKWSQHKASQQEKALKSPGRGCADLGPDKTQYANTSRWHGSKTITDSGNITLELQQFGIGASPLVLWEPWFVWLFLVPWFSPDFLCLTFLLQGFSGRLLDYCQVKRPPRDDLLMIVWPTDPEWENT